MKTTPRLRPLEAPFEPTVEEALLRRMPKSAGLEPLALFRLFVRDPSLADALEPLGRFNLKYEPGVTSSITPRDREIVIQRVCARCGCEYEWGVHVAAYAARVGIGEAQVAATRLGNASDPAFTPRDALLVALVDALHDEASVSDELWASLAARFSEIELLQLLVLAGWYHAISYVANGARLAPEAWAARFPDAAGAASPS